MAFMKFYVGTEASIQEHLDGIYLATDTHKIFYNGSAYGGSDVDLSEYATKEELNDYCPLDGGFILSNLAEHYPRYASVGGIYTSLKLNDNVFQGIFSVIHTSSGKYPLFQNAPKEFNVVGSDYLLIHKRDLLDKSEEEYGECGAYLVVHKGSMSVPGYDPGDYGDTTGLYLGVCNSKSPNDSKIIKYGIFGVTIKDKTSSDLLHAAGGTISIEELKSQLNIPDTSTLQDAIGTNVYTGANYISKETNLTEAVLQLDEEIKATNDNLALEHTNAEATYAKKTELSNQIEAVQADVNSTNTKIVNAKLSMASWTSGANATKLTFTGSSVGLGGTPAIFFSQGGITGGGNAIPTQACIRFEGCHIYQDSNGFYVSLPKASDTSDGVMSGEDHKKLGGILNTTKNWVNEVRNDSIPTLPSSATVYKIMDLPGMSAECRASLYLICVQINSSSDKPRIYYNDETLCYLQPVVNGIYQYATGIMVLPDYSISGIYLGETYDYTNN